VVCILIKNFQLAATKKGTYMIIRFWTREIGGWLLVGLGLLAFSLCTVLLFNHNVIEAGPMMVIGIFVYRGGIHLLKVAVAAQVCLEARDPGAAPQPPGKTQLGSRRPTLGRQLP
jgi:hypothetical protein